MAAKYDFFLTPQPKDKQKVRYHARVVIYKTVSTRDIENEIARRTAINRGEAGAVMDVMAEILRQELAEGNSVHIDGIGSFRIKAKSPSVRSKKEVRSESIKFGGIVYTPEKKLLRQLSSTKFFRTRYTTCSIRLSQIEIDGRLTEHFKDHAYITTKDMQVLCGLSYHTALRRLQERIKEGKLTHPGHRRAPFYFPVPGNYGISRDQGSSVV